MNTLQKFEATQVAKLTEGKTFPAFGPGDTVKVNIKIVEGDRERIRLAVRGAHASLSPDRSAISTR